MTIWCWKRKRGEPHNPLHLLFEVSMGMDRRSFSEEKGRKPWFSFALPFHLLGLSLFPRDYECNIEGWVLRLYLLPNIGRVEGEWVFRYQWTWRIGKQITRELLASRR